MSRTARWIAAAGGLAAVVVLFIVLRPNDEPGPPVTTTPPTTPSVTTEPPTTEPTPTETTTEPTQTPTTPDALEVEVEVEGDRVDVTVEGEPAGDGPVTVTLGERVVLVVQADRSDEVHLHGYDLKDNVAPGSPARIVFRADVAGIFEVELEGDGTPLLSLEVRP